MVTLFYTMFKNLTQTQHSNSVPPQQQRNNNNMKSASYRQHQLNPATPEKLQNNSETNHTHDATQLEAVVQLRGVDDGLAWSLSNASWDTKSTV